MAPTVYLDLVSAPVQAVAMTVRKAGLESIVESKHISLQQGDHMKPEYLKVRGTAWTPRGPLCWSYGMMD